MGTGFEHLSDAQLEQYGTESVPANREEEQRMEAHLAECDQCRARVLEKQRARLGLLTDTALARLKRPADQTQSPANKGQGTVSAAGAKPTAKASGAPSGDGKLPVPACTISNGPTQDDLFKVAFKEISAEQAAPILQHCARCEHCAAILQEHLEFRENVEFPEQPEFLEQLKTSTPKWQKEMAARAVRENATLATRRAAAEELGHDGGIASTSRAKVFGWPMRHVLVPAAIAATALIAVGLWFTQRDTPEKVEKLLAQAYTENRTMEYRWPGAEWGPLRVKRGPQESTLARPTSQLEAEKILAGHQGNILNDPNWLTAKAEAELMDNHPELAITDLRQAITEHPESSNMELMLAIAYAQQADQKNDEVSRGIALELLNKLVAQKTPPDPVALFNRALVYQRLGNLEQARNDLAELLRSERKSGWSEESLQDGHK